MKRKKKLWKLVGYDTFSNEYYDLDSFYTEAEAKGAAKKRLAELNISQPPSSSGGQGFFGIQDRVYIEGPDGTGHRV